MATKNVVADELLRLPELTRLYPGTGYTWWWRRVSAGRIPALQIGGAWIVKRSDVEKYIATLQRGGAS